MATQTVQLWDYWYILRKRKWMILATLLVILFIATLVNLLQKPIYSSFSDLIVEINQPTQIITSQSSQGYSQGYFDSVFFDTQAKLMTSSYFKDLVAGELLKDRLALPDYLRDAKKGILFNLAGTSIITVPSTKAARIIRITVENEDPKLATLLANTIARVYIRHTQESQLDSSRQTLVFLMQKLEEIRDKLKESKTSILDLDIESQLTAASKIYGENHPVIIELKARKKAIEERALSAKATTESVSVQDTSSLHDSDTDKFLLSRSAQINEELYQILLKKLQELNITSNISAFNVRVIELAKASSRPVRPNKRLNTMIGILMGVVMGTGLAFFREYLDVTIKTVEDLKGFNLAVLGLIPCMEKIKPKSAFEALRERFFKKQLTDIGKNVVKDELSFHVHRLASREEIDAPIGEAYRTLRTNLQFVQLDRPLKKLLITSSIRGEGKTTTAVNLGIILAQTGKKVLIIDTDLRRPRIHKAFEKEREVGLTNILLGESSFEDVTLATDVDNLTILPSGPLPPNPAELVANDKMKNLIKYIESKYDIIIFDSPPLIAVTDAALLATEVDAVLMIVEADALPRDLLRQGLERLSNVKANIVGSVLNNVNLQRGSYYYYYYRYYHYDYDSSKKA